jgi:spore germination protein KB
MNKKESISSKQAIMIMLMFMIGGAVIGGGPREAERDAWLAALVGAVMAIPAYFVYARIIKLFPEKDFSEILKSCFGSILGNAIYLVYILFAFYIGALVVRRFSEFIQISVLPETPQFVFAIAITVVALYIAKAGIEVLGRWSTFVLPILISVILLSVLLALKDADFKFLQPMFQIPISKLVKSGLGQFGFPYAETVLFLMLSGSIKGGKRPYKIFYFTLLIFTAVFVVIILRNLAVMGIINTKYAAFPSYAAVSIIEIGTFLTRIEVIVSIVFLLAMLVKISVCLMAASKGVSRLLQLETHKGIAAPIAVLMLFLSTVIYQNAMEMIAFLQLYGFFILPLETAFPLLIWIVAEIKTRREKKKQDKPEKTAPEKSPPDKTAEGTG